MQTNPAVEQSKIIRWSESPCNQSLISLSLKCGKLLVFCGIGLVQV